VAIEMNPRVSRSSALASKATGFPIAKIAAKLALGYHLDEIPTTSRAHARVVRADDRLHRRQVPALELREVPAGDRTLTTQMKSVGEAMAIGRTFKEAFSRTCAPQHGKLGTCVPAAPDDVSDERGGRGALRKRLVVAERPRACGRLFRRAAPRLEHRDDSRADEDRQVVPSAFADIDELRRWRRSASSATCRHLLRTLKRSGFSDAETSRSVHGV
jgi:carbamoyl-phosphate synthase large subunit